MKRVLIALGVVAIILVAYIVIHFGMPSMQQKSVAEAANLKSPNITKIIFYDGRGGLNQPLSVDNRQKIDEFMGYLSKCMIKKSAHNSLSSGWIHSAVFLSNGKQLAKITFGNQMIVNDEYYDVLTNEPSPSKIDSFLKTVYPSWKSS